MTSYAYGSKPGTFASIREEAKEPWRGITALLNERPYLVIGKDGEKFVLEGEDGDIQTLESFQWTQATEGSRLVSASRHPETALTKGSVFGQFTVGKLAYEDGEWYVRNGETDEVLPLEWITSRLEAVKNDPLKLAWDIRLKAAERMGLSYDDADYKCPMCGSHEIHFDSAGGDAHCQSCGHIGTLDDFTDEPPDYDDHHGEWYPDWTGPKAGASKVAATFEMPMPRDGIHFRTHNALGKAGITGTVQYPPLPGSEEFGQGLVGQFPGNTALDEMDYTTDMENLGMNPNEIMLQVTVPDGQEDQARQIIDQWGDPGNVHGKVALEMQDESGPGETDIESENRAIVCPNCGSHTLRSFGVQKDLAQLKCLTCGNEFTRPAMKNPESKVAEDAHKFIPGQRVQLTHPNYKGERGSIVDYSGKHADLGEEQYEIQLDSGDKITNIPESAFNKIKSARVDNSDLPDSTSKHFLDTMVFVSDYPDGGGKQETLPLTEWDKNKTPEHYDPKVQDNPHVEPEEVKDLCPMCNEGEGTSLGAFGAREYFRCKNCGMDWSQPNMSESEAWGKPGEDPDNMFGQDKPEYQQFSHTGSRLDSAGNKLEAGRVYLMSGKNYTVPDLVRILNLEDSRIEAAIASDAKGAFPIVIEASDESDYKFEPVGQEQHGHTVVHHELQSTSGWKLSRKNWSSKEQRALIEENPEGRARNMDKLDLSGTHYEMKSEAFNDPDFLWG